MSASPTTAERSEGKSGNPEDPNKSLRDEVAKKQKEADEARLRLEEKEFEKGEIGEQTSRREHDKILRESRSAPVLRTDIENRRLVSEAGDRIALDLLYRAVSDSLLPENAERSADILKSVKLAVDYGSATQEFTTLQAANAAKSP